VAWLLLAYAVVASLHALAPQLWARHFGEDGDNGPFRVLIFSLVTAVALALVLLRALNATFLPFCPQETPRRRSPWSSPSIRAPPFSA